MYNWKGEKVENNSKFPFKKSKRFVSSYNEQINST